MTDGARCLYVFMDESGNFDFSGRGSDHLVLSAMYTEHPEVTAAAMQQLKYSLLKSGSSDLEFHATQNSYGTRARVIDTIVSVSDAFNVHSLWLDKHYAHPNLHDAVSMLKLFGGAMGRWINYNYGSEYDRIILVFDSVLTGKQRGAFLGAMRETTDSFQCEVKTYFHPVKSDMNGQIADYYAWAMFRKLESNDFEPSKKLLENSKANWSEFNLFHRGHTKYW